MPYIYVSIIVSIEQTFFCREVLEFLEIPYKDITVTYKHEEFIGQNA